MAKIQLPYGLHDERLLHISEVSSGLDCDCVCPSCKSQLVARKGEKTRHHFAHHSNSECKEALETTAHLIAKEVLMEATEITLPPVEIYFETGRGLMRLVGAKRYKIDRIRVEERIGQIIPDLILTIGGRDLIVEIFVTHRTDSIKREKIRKLGISAIEIALTQALWEPDTSDIKDIVVDNWLYKTWLYNVRANDEYERLMRNAVKMPLVLRGIATHVDQCPIQARSWRGKPYANLVDDCFNCDYLLEGKSEKGFIYCIGHRRQEVER